MNHLGSNAPKTRALGIVLLTFGALGLFLLPCLLFANFMNRSEAQHVLSEGTTVQGRVNRVSHQDSISGIRGVARSETNYVGFEYPNAAGKRVTGGSQRWVSHKDIAPLSVGSSVTLIRTAQDVYLKAPVVRVAGWNVFDVFAIGAGVAGAGLSVIGCKMTRGNKGTK